MKYKSISVDLNKLKLDVDNYRIIKPDIKNESDIFDYFYIFDNLAELISSVASNATIAGERIVVRDNGSGMYRVCEGNRRVSAYKFLADLLRPRNVKPHKPDILPDIRKQLNSIDCDLIETDEDEDVLLIKRHIEGPKKWNTISKLKNVYEIVQRTGIGKINELAAIYGFSKNRIYLMLKKYALLEFAKNKSRLSKNKRYLMENNPENKFDPFLRMFTSKSKKYNKNLQDLLMLSFDKNKLTFTSSFDENNLSKILRILLDKTILNKNKNARLTTRQHIEDVPEILHFFKNLKGTNKNLNEQQNIKLSPKKEWLKFSALSTSLSPKIPDYFGIIQIVGELNWLSKSYEIKRSSLAILYLSRSLLENSVKMYLKYKHNNIYKEYEDELKSKNFSLSSLLNIIVKNKKKIFNERKFARDFDIFMANKTKDMLDDLVHNPQSFSKTREEVKKIVNGKLFDVLSYFINF